MTAIEVVAAAKLNFALEITGRRSDGYHDIVSVMQSIDLCDRLRMTAASGLDLSVHGSEARGVPDGPANLAFAAAQALAEAAGSYGFGAHIELAKCIPAGAGLGGGSSDAAAVLRALNRLWHLDYSDQRLCEIGARIGSDVAACLMGGATLVTGRGEKVEALPDGHILDITLFIPATEATDKTRRMYARITPADFTDGRKALALAETLRRGLPVSPADLVNAFDAHVGAETPAVANAMAACREAGLTVLATGSGPGFFALAGIDTLPEGLADRLERRWRVRVVGCRTLSRPQALAMREV